MVINRNEHKDPFIRIARCVIWGNPYRVARLVLVLGFLRLIPGFTNKTQKNIMQKLKKILKWIGISIGSLIALFIFLGIVLPKVPVSETKEEPVIIADSVDQNAEVIPSVSDTTSKPQEEIVVAQQPVVPAAPKPVVTQPVANPTPSAPQYTYYSVTQVVDGDTVKVNMNGTVTTLRLIGMDTPETVDPRKPVQCFGTEASNKAKELLVGKKIRIEKDSTQGELDKYGRTLAYVYREDGLFFNKYMIEQGYAHEYTYNTPYKYQAEFKTAQTSARDNQRGLWSPNTCNGDTTSEEQTPASVQASGKFYTSSHHSSIYYYPEACSGWQTLSPSYLKSFDSLEALLAAYPSKTKSPQCE